VIILKDFLDSKILTDEVAMSDQQMIAVEASELNFWYGAFHALEDISLNIQSKKITSLIGPSGCGKSTFLKSLNRINERNSLVTVKGDLKVFGKNVYAQDVVLEDLRKEVGMVFQRPNPLPISIYDNVLFGLMTHTKKGTYTKEELNHFVEEALKIVHLWNDLKDKLHAPALNLQLEMQQKLCLARLLPLKPKLILLDEPCSALDARGTLAVEELIKELRANYTIIIVTHSMSQARRVSDDCIFMYMGKIVEAGSTNQIFTLPKSQQTQNYIEGRI
jgi:phosphate transport system ATP-binding protein